jgi:hypothetical protein
MKDPKWEDMIGHTLIEVNHERHGVALLTSRSGIEYYWEAETWADCCSDTWIESVEIYCKLPDDAPTITEIVLDPYGEGDELKVYKHIFRTTRGDVVVDFRNESNGYYGGELHLVSMTVCGQGFIFVTKRLVIV